MRATSRLLAVVRPAARYLEPGTPTGLTGIATHSSPRSTLLYLYTSTLDKLKAAPEHSVYRQSVEALTKHRLALVEGVVPSGYEEWAERARKLIKENPEQFSATTGASRSGAAAVKVERGGHAFVVARLPDEGDMRLREWDGEIDEGPELEGSRPLEERQGLRQIFERKDLNDEVGQVAWEPEPQLTADQWVFVVLERLRERMLTVVCRVSELETKIGAGLIEEVIEVAEGELKLADTMLQAKV